MCSDFTLSALDPVKIGSALPVKSFARLGFLLLMYDKTRMEALLLVSDLIHLEPNISLQSPVCLGFTLSIYGLSRLGLVLSALDLVHLDLASFIHSMVCADLALFAYGLAKLDSLVSTSDLVLPGALVADASLLPYGVATFCLGDIETRFIVVGLGLRDDGIYDVLAWPHVYGLALAGLWHHLSWLFHLGVGFDDFWFLHVFTILHLPRTCPVSLWHRQA